MCNSHEHRQTAGFIPSAQGLILGEIPGAQILLEPSAKSGRAALSPLAGRLPPLARPPRRSRAPPRPRRRAHAGELLPAQRRQRPLPHGGRR